PTVVVYYTGKIYIQHDNKTMVVAEVAKTDIVFFNQGRKLLVKLISVDQTTVISIKEQTLEVEKTEDEASQASADQTTVVYVKEQTIEVAQTKVVISHQEEDVGELSQTKESKEEVEQNKEEVFEGKDDDYGNSQNKPYPEQVIDVYIKALIQYFNTQYHAHPDSKRIMLANIFACQYIGRAFNVWTRNPDGVELKKKSIWEQITSMQWDRTFSNCIHRGDLKV
ncbi:hypothetical protein GIB67_022123, partial [Kingdonia uniflora]